MATDALQYQPAHLVAPGDTLLEWLEATDMSQAELAKRTRLTPKHITQVVKGKVGISPEVAVAFERVTAIPARYWLQLDANYQTEKHRRHEVSLLRDRADLAYRFPLTALQRRGHINATGTDVDRLQALLRFFGVADPDALEDVWLKPAMYRKSPAFKADPGALAAWLRLAELEAEQIRTQRCDLDAIRDVVPQMRSLSRLPGIDWIDPLTDLCSTAGIAVVILKELPKCRVNGATRWISPDKAMIALSLRHRRNDIFWFTFFHELCHLLRHSKKETFVDGTGTVDKALEEEADAFAARVLIPPKAARELPKLRTLTQVRHFAAEIGVADGIVVGRMQHDELIPHNQWTDAIVRYQFGDD